MHTESPPQPLEPESHRPSSLRQRVKTTDLLHGSREVILLHEEEEYTLRITKARKLILTT
jgi:hemin uptake protein HemP